MLNFYIDKHSKKIVSDLQIKDKIKIKDKKPKEEEKKKCQR